MKTLQLILVFTLFCFKYGESYSKYGRTCKDIGCTSNEECVMAETPCSYYSRENECGMYPTCQKVSSNSAPSCATYVCPPTKRCIVDGREPKCVDDEQANIPGNQNGNKAYQSYDTQNTNGQPSAPAQPNQYPVLPGQTTTRSPNRRPGYSGGGGYQGGSVGSGYPGQGGGYQGGSVGSGYPGQGGGYQGGQVGSGYPGQSGGSYPGNSGGGSRYQGYRGGNVGSGYPGGYPQQGNQGRYPQQGYQGGYPQQGYQGGYQQHGYQGGYPQQNYRPGSGGGYNNYNNQKPAKSSGSNPLYDTLKNTLASYGTNLLKNALGGIKL